MALEEDLAGEALRRAHQAHRTVGQMREEAIRHGEIIGCHLRLGDADLGIDHPLAMGDALEQCLMALRGTCDFRDTRLRGGGSAAAFGGSVRSSRQSRNRGWRSRLSRVGSVKATSIRCRGSTHTAPLGGLPSKITPAGG